ncbi:MAG TPA: PHP domain-containing protein [Gemmatimonadaceae bacterium]|nr:PHP domain-containing protein [Gemmatimonadaceae bacterium]
MISCALHVHSTYSDGEFTLAELRDTYVRAGRRAVLLADHAEYFDAARVAEYVADCARHSDAALQMVPGLEFGCEDRMHIVGYGVTALTDQRDPQAVIAHIQMNGGVSVIAHPRDDHFPLIESFQLLPLGIEAWNTKYDGRYAPRAHTFQLIDRLRGRQPELLAFYGTDLHWRTQFRDLEIIVRAPTNAGPEILAALKRGDFRARKGSLELQPRTTPSAAQLKRFRVLNNASRLMWRTLKAIKTASGSVGNRLPAPIKAQLRRIF